jgi:hypothetical protein
MPTDIASILLRKRDAELRAATDAQVNEIIVWTWAAVGLVLSALFGGGFDSEWPLNLVIPA